MYLGTSPFSSSSLSGFAVSAAAPLLRACVFVPLRFVVVASSVVSSAVPLACDVPPSYLVAPACVVAFAPLPCPRASAAFPFLFVRGGDGSGVAASVVSSAVPVA